MKRTGLMGKMFAAAAAIVLLACAGCTGRGLTVTSEPPGAEVSINRRVVGKTPIRVTFDHYGTYRIELRKEGFKVLVREEPVRPPIYGYDPVAFVADNVVPARLNDEVYLHYALKPLELKDDKDSLTERESLLERAVAARNGTVTHPLSGEIVQVKLDRIPPASPGELLAVHEEDDIIRKKDVRESGAGETPLIAQKSDTIKDKPSLERPKEANLAQQFGIDVPPPPVAAKPDTRGAFVAPETLKPEKPKTIRAPKDELLIYQAPKIEKKDEKGEKKNDSAKEPPVPAGPTGPQKVSSN